MICLVCHPERSRRALLLDVGFDFAQPDKTGIKSVESLINCGKKINHKLHTFSQIKIREIRGIRGEKNIKPQIKKI